MAQCRRGNSRKRSRPAAATGSTAGWSGWPRWIWSGLRIRLQSPKTAHLRTAGLQPACRRDAGGPSRLLSLNDELGGAGADFVGEFGRAARVEIEVDAVLAEPRDLRPVAWVGHDMDQA